MTNNVKRVLFLVLLSFVSTNIFPGLLPGTMVLVGQDDYRKVEDLSVGDPILLYNVRSQGIEKKEHRIEKIKVRKSKEITLIETDRELIAFGSNQKVCNSRIRKFISASKFVVGDEIFFPGVGCLPVRKIFTEKLDNKIKLYDISVEDGNLFLIKTENETHILVHNFAFAVPLFTYTIGGKLALVGFKIAVAALAKAVLEDVFSKKKSKNKGRTFPGLDEILGDDAEEQERGRGGTSDVYKKKGGDDQAEEDFGSSNDGDAEYKETKNGPIRIGKTKDGHTVILRGFSGEGSGNEPTLEFQLGKHDYVKIRYPE